MDDESVRPVAPVTASDAVLDIGTPPNRRAVPENGTGQEPEAGVSEAQAPGGQDAGLISLFKDAIDVTSEYRYLDIDDPDRKHIEHEYPGSRFVAAVQFFVRGHAVPWLPLFCVTLYTTFIVIVSWLIARNWDQNTPENCSSRWWCTPIAVDSAVASYVGFALFLLLGFRVNESYVRYMSALALWNDSITGTIAGLSTYISMTFRRGLFHENDRERMLGLLAAFAVCLKRDLRGEQDLRELKTMLGPQDLAEIQASPDMPGHCLHILHAYLVTALHKSELQLPSPFIPMLMQMVLSLAGHQAQCMRIRKYKMAYSYGSHLRLFLIIWLILLPLALVETSGWYCILWCPFITWGIWGSETAANELSNPFGYDFNDLRLGEFTRNIQVMIRRIYAKSLDRNLSFQTGTPNMLLVPQSEGGTLQDPEPEPKKKK